MERDLFCECDKLFNSAYCRIMQVGDLVLLCYISLITPLVSFACSFGIYSFFRSSDPQV